MGLFDGIFSSSDGKKAATAANKATVSGYQTGLTNANTALDTGLAAATDNYTNAKNLFDQWYNTGSSANAMYGNALGLNGAEGNAAATAAFQTSPGYQFQVDQATEAAKRNASSLGMLGSGNTLIGIADRTQNIANQEYNNWLNNLNTASASGQSAAGSQAGIETGLGDLNYNTGNTKAGYEYQTATGIGQANAQLAADKYAAEQSASGNIWNAILGVGNLAAKFYGGRA